MGKEDIYGGGGAALKCCREKKRGKEVLVRGGSCRLANGGGKGWGKKEARPEVPEGRASLPPRKGGLARLAGCIIILKQGRFGKGGGS